MKHPEFLKNINWNLLREQKEQMNDLIGRLRGDAIQYHKDGQKGLEKETNRDVDSLEGILHLIDAIQDYATGNMGIDEDEVFYLNLKE